MARNEKRKKRKRKPKDNTMKYNTFRLKEKKNPAGFKFKQWYFVEKFPNIKQQEGLKPPK